MLEHAVRRRYIGASQQVAELAWDQRREIEKVLGPFLRGQYRTTALQGPGTHAVTIAARISLGTGARTAIPSWRRDVLGMASRARVVDRKPERLSSEAPFLAQPDESSLSPYLHDAEGWLYRLELVDCGKGWSGRCRKRANGPGHGPYWYRYRWDNGKMLKRYVGKTLRLSTLRSKRQQSEETEKQG